jgi:hypothetical protein
LDRIAVTEEKAIGSCGPIFHSYLKDSIGLTLDARRAGIKLAKRATMAKSIDTLTSVATSKGLTPYRRLAITRASNTAPIKPRHNPMCSFQL